MNIKATGRFFMEAVEVSTGKVIDTYEANNLVVNTGLLNLCKLVAGDAAGHKLSQIAVGTGSAAPALTDTAITSPFVKDIASVSYVGNNIIQFNYSIEAGEANGKTIQEAGLLTDNNILFARKKRDPIVKTSAIALRGVWEIKFS